jgi:hypothetical protein
MSGQELLTRASEVLKSRLRGQADADPAILSDRARRVDNYSEIQCTSVRISIALP